MVDNKIKLALVQPQIEWEEKERNYASAGKWIGEAVRQGAEAVFFPEMSFTGFSMNTEITGEKDARTIEHMSALARQHHVSVGFGWVKDCVETCGKCENHYTIVDSAGEVLSDYAKLHPFSYSGRIFGSRAAARWRTLRCGASRAAALSAMICVFRRFFRRLRGGRM